MYDHWASVWGNAISIGENRPESYNRNLTFRYPIYSQFGGKAVRLTFDNYCGTEPVTFDKVTVFIDGKFYPITFNFGWLPKGDHNIFTNKSTSIPAIEKGMKLLKSGGIMTLIIYYGRETGFEERDALLEYLPTIDSSRYTVIEMPFVNRPNCPPIPIIILKDM